MEQFQGLPAALSLTHYRRAVASQYLLVRDGGAGESPWAAWREARDCLIGRHPDSPLPESRRRDDWRTPFAPYDPSWRLLADLRPVDDPATLEIPHSADGVTRFVEAGTIDVRRGDVAASLTVFWLDAYGGGVFVPFRDTTNGQQTYGGGRYLLDTVKGADLGLEAGQMVLDFNYAYHPSCAWDSRWSCPMAPSSNWLDAPVAAGEQLPLGPLA